MDSELAEERPVSPKKKLRPNSSSNSEVSNSDSILNATDEKDSAGSETNLISNGLAPTRTGRGVSPISSTSNIVSSPAERDSGSSSSQSRPTNAQYRASNIQEEEVSSSENAVYRKQTTNFTEGDADSLTNGDADAVPLIREADAK
ncbi:uncharacterized G-patch domain protein DDB_G0278987 [Parasteatoda tepidariorum]|uniref:uncharacterized G-patch domain protein DDB_G0278987 n=1 Tax=Parasteatoda tepidariorum TaxID=114398 RepID=UPI00077FC63C|nr:uncharacterized protein LOC107442603 [Parasteatoda tepidariorum]